MATRPHKTAVAKSPKQRLATPENDHTAETISSRMIDLLAQKGLTQSALARAVGVKQQSIFYLLHPRGGVTPKTRYLNRIAEVLGVDPAWLETGLGDPKGGNIVTSNGQRIGRRIPVWDAGSILRRDSTQIVREITCDTDEDGAFGFAVKDDAMSPDVVRGDLLVVAPKSQITPGSIGVFLVDGAAEIRRLRVVGTGKKPRFQLVAVHPDFPSFDSEVNEIKMIGVVIEQRRSLLK